ncbi:MAG TPA: hypothetical protein PK453_08985 [Leptospiraceae bacterium]|nr:hypothetical protein [Leptospiraceae bacterium]HMY66041.1 hypothetical protein [Leptospiraceae bacterium]HNF13790.1 hypothetical protein [Leptospiraceae bacterium]HNF24686.1 hypothetical protein [Leptospiraceae bacterium]HNH11045.1 hypothetical protein [Leptospiraceae bacterium]
MNKTNNGSPVIEWASFELAENTTEAQLLAASDDLQRNFLDKQPGFLKRELLFLSDRKWVDLVHWENGDCSEKAMDSAMQSEACLKYFHLMVPADQQSGAGVIHLTQKKAYFSGKRL